MKLPQHVIDMARAFREGDESVREPLHDALCEVGFAKLAGNHLIRCKCESGSGFCSMIYDILEIGGLHDDYSDQVIERVTRIRGDLLP